MHSHVGPNSVTPPSVDMTDFQVNSGRFFSRPYESMYSILRRFYCSNAGVPESVLRAMLRKSHDEKKSHLERIYSLCNMQYINNSYNNFEFKADVFRQCPKCSFELYHSNIFLLPWINRCPIHQCKITSICPECNNPWPKTTSINSRSCPCCGRLNLKQIRYVNENIDWKYQAIGEIYKIITDHENNSVCLDITTSITSRFENYVYRQAGVASSIYPSLLTSAMKDSGHDVLSRCNIELRQVSTRIAAIQKISHRVGWQNIETGSSLRRLNIHQCNELAIWKSWLYSEYVAMKKIIVWIQSHTENEHSIHLSEYRTEAVVRTSSIIRPCLYCMSLSVWFLFIAYKYIHCQ